MTAPVILSKAKDLKRRDRRILRCFAVSAAQHDGFSAGPAETPAHIMWTEIADSRTARRTAENGPVSLSFLPFRLTGRKGEDCYTFERVASSPDEFRTNYYYHYKRTRVGLKEETTWS
jgi:hypothetical protein